MEVSTQTEPLNLQIAVQIFKPPPKPDIPTDDAARTDACSGCEKGFFCPMCQDTEKCILVLPKCQHRIHTHCAPPWFGQQKKDTCPVCREPQPPSFVQKYQIPADAERARMETLRQRYRDIMNAFMTDMGDTPLETERSIRTTLSRLDDLAPLMGDGEEGTTVQAFRERLWSSLPSNHGWLTGNELDEGPMSEDDLPSTDDDGGDDWVPERPVSPAATEERTTRSIADERTQHVIDNLNIALASNRDQYGIERALRVGLRQLSRVERLAMDSRNRFEIQMLRRNLTDMLPSHHLRSHELLHLQRTMPVQDAPMPSRREEEVESEALPARRTLRQLARNPFVPRDYPARRVVARRPRIEERQRLYESDSDDIQIVDVWSTTNRN